MLSFKSILCGTSLTIRTATTVHEVHSASNGLKLHWWFRSRCRHRDSGPDCCLKLDWRFRRRCWYWYAEHCCRLKLHRWLRCGGGHRHARCCNCQSRCEQQRTYCVLHNFLLPPSFVSSEMLLMLLELRIDYSRNYRVPQESCASERYTNSHIPRCSF